MPNLQVRQQEGSWYRRRMVQRTQGCILTGRGALRPASLSCLLLQQAVCAQRKTAAGLHLTPACDNRMAVLPWRDTPMGRYRVRETSRQGATNSSIATASQEHRPSLLPVPELGGIQRNDIGCSSKWQPQPQVSSSVS
jgi:hypothetical protein